MLINKDSPNASILQVIAVPGNYPIEMVRAVDTDEGWVECFVMETDNEGKRRAVVDFKKHEVVTFKVHRNFQVVDKSTREVVASFKDHKYER